MTGALPHTSPPVFRTRLFYVALAVITITVGLVVHGSMAGLSDAARDITGDALWAVMIVWWIGALLPRRGPLARAAIAYGICTAVELSQLYHTPALDSIRETTLGGLVLGSGFDPRDLLAYALGVAVALAIDVVLVPRVVRRAATL